MEHPRAGLIFMIPGVDETLRVNGVVAIFRRSGLWNPQTRPADRPVPTMGEMIHDQIDEAVAVETQQSMIARYLDGLY